MDKELDIPLNQINIQEVSSQEPTSEKFKSKTEETAPKEKKSQEKKSEGTEQQNEEKVEESISIERTWRDDLKDIFVPKNLVPYNKTKKKIFEFMEDPSSSNLVRPFFSFFFFKKVDI